MYLVGGEDWQTQMHKKTKVRIWMNSRIDNENRLYFHFCKRNHEEIMYHNLLLSINHLYNIYNLETLPDLCFLMDLQDVKRIIGCNKIGIFDMNW